MATIMTSVDSLVDLHGHTYSLLGGSVITSYHPHTWADDCPTRDRYCDEACCCGDEVNHVDAVIVIWVEGRPITSEPKDASFRILIWKFPHPFSLVTWKEMRSYSMLWKQPADEDDEDDEGEEEDEDMIPIAADFTLAATVDTRDQEFCYRDLMKPYMKMTKFPYRTEQQPWLFEVFDLSTTTFQAKTSRTKYLNQLKKQLTDLMTETARVQDPENPHVAPRKKK